MGPAPYEPNKYIKAKPVVIEIFFKCGTHFHRNMEYKKPIVPLAANASIDGVGKSFTTINENNARPKEIKAPLQFLLY